MNKTHLQLLNLLSTGEPVSGELLGQKLGITRAAIWKAIKLINTKYHLNIESVANKGYCLPSGICLLDRKKINSKLSFFEILPVVNSTNDYLLNQIREIDDNIAAVLAEQQTAGRGRRGKQWLSPFGSNMYCSLLYRFNKEPAELLGLSLVIAIAVVDALIEYGLPTEKLKAKWPNDIYFDGKKLSGILIDLVAEAGAGCAVVIGVGINTCRSECDQPVAAIDAILHKLTDRNKLASLLLKQLARYLTQFEQSGLSDFLTQWHQLDYFLNQSVRVLQGEKVIEGIYQGISAKGELLVDVAGVTQTFLSGEVSLRAARQFL